MSTFLSFRHTCECIICFTVSHTWFEALDDNGSHVKCYDCPASLQLRLGRQRLPHHADRVQQSFHPHLWWEWSREDGGLQEDSAVLRRQLSEHHSTKHRQGQNAHVQPCPRGLTVTHVIPLEWHTKKQAMLTLMTLCGMVFPHRLSATPKHWKMTTRVGSGSIWTFSLTAR